MWSDYSQILNRNKGGSHRYQPSHNCEILYWSSLLCNLFMCSQQTSKFKPTNSHFYLHNILFFFELFILYNIKFTFIYHKIGVSSINNVIVSEQWRDSAIHTHVPILPSCPRCHMNIKQSCMCYTIGPCWLSILNTAVVTWPSRTPSHPIPRPPTQQP